MPGILLPSTRAPYTLAKSRLVSDNLLTGTPLHAPTPPRLYPCRTPRSYRHHRAPNRDPAPLPRQGPVSIRAHRLRRTRAPDHHGLPHVRPGKSRLLPPPRLRQRRQLMGRRRPLLRYPDRPLQTPPSGALLSRLRPPPSRYPLAHLSSPLLAGRLLLLGAA